MPKRPLIFALLMALAPVSGPAHAATDTPLSWSSENHTFECWDNQRAVVLFSGCSGTLGGNPATGSIHARAEVDSPFNGTLPGFGDVRSTVRLVATDGYDPSGVYLVSFVIDDAVTFWNLNPARFSTNTRGLAKIDLVASVRMAGCSQDATASTTLIETPAPNNAGGGEVRTLVLLPPPACTPASNVVEITASAVSFARLHGENGMPQTSGLYADLFAHVTAVRRS